MSQELARLDEAAHLVPVTTATITDEEIDRLYRVAKALALSRTFKDVTQAEQAFARILLGRDLGLSPAQSLTAIDLVRGNVQVRSVMLGSWVKRHPDYDYRVVPGEHDDKHCVIEFYEIRADGERDLLGVSSFDEADATRAGLLSKDGPWKQYPKNMYWARAMSNGVKMHCPDVTGGIPVYTEGDTFDSTAEDITATDDSRAASHEFPPNVEAVLVRAAEAGHDALANREAAALATGGQPDDVVAAWVQGATLELDALTPPEAEVVPDVLEGIAAAGLRLGEVKAEIAEAEAAGDDERLAELCVEAEQLREVLAQDGPKA